MSVPTPQRPAGAVGLAHYERLFGINYASTTAGPTTALYAVVDRRQDGRRRIVAERTDPQAALAAADQMRAAGAAVEIVLISEVRETTPP